MMYAKYTIVLKNLLDDPAAKAAIDKALSTYPIYQKKSKEEFIPAYIPTREELNAKILRHYKYREIGFETFGRFLDELECAMMEIMPKYNLLFMTADQDFNPIYNVDYKRTISREQQGENNADTTTSETTGTETSSTASDNTTSSTTVGSDSKKVQSKTPQGQIDIPAKNIDSITYADEVNWGKDNSTSEGTSTSSGSTTAESSTETEGTSKMKGTSKENEETLETTKGNFGVVSAQDLILKFRETIVNIEQEIINDPRISELFMLVY